MPRSPGPSPQSTPQLGRANAFRGGTFFHPRGLAVHPDLYQVLVTDESHRLLRVDLNTGSAEAVAGVLGKEGFKDGIGESAKFSYPLGVAVTEDGRQAVVADTGNHAIRLVDLSNGSVRTLAGSGSAGCLDKQGSEAEFAIPTGVTVVGQHVYVADSGNNKIRRVSLETGVASTLAGTGSGGHDDGRADEARFCRPFGIDAITHGDSAERGVCFVVADRKNSCIRQIQTAL